MSTKPLHPAHPPSGTSLKSSHHVDRGGAFSEQNGDRTTEASAITLIHDQSDRGSALRRFLRMQAISVTYSEFGPVSWDIGALVPLPQLRLISAFPERKRSAQQSNSL